METNSYYVNHNKVTVEHDKSYSIHILYLDLDWAVYTFPTASEMVKWVAENLDVFDYYKGINSLSGIVELIEDTYPEEDLATQMEYAVKATKLFLEAEDYKNKK